MGIKLKKGVGKTLIKNLLVAACKHVLLHSRQISLLKGELLLLFFFAFIAASAFLSEFFIAFFRREDFFCVQPVLLLIGGASGSLQAIRRRA